MPYISTKTYGHEVGLSCAFRQWRADSHCRLIHGYALSIRVEFEADELDHRNWVVDFGGLKSFKQMLVDCFDHKLAVAYDDPELATFRELEAKGLCELAVMPAVGCEAFAAAVYQLAEVWVQTTIDPPYRVRVRLVEVKEHGANSAIYTGRSA